MLLSAAPLIYSLNEGTASLTILSETGDLEGRIRAVVIGAQVAKSVLCINDCLKKKGAATFPIGRRLSPLWFVK